MTRRGFVLFVVVTVLVAVLGGAVVFDVATPTGLITATDTGDTREDRRLVMNASTQPLFERPVFQARDDVEVDGSFFAQGDSSWPQPRHDGGQTGSVEANTPAIGASQRITATVSGEVIGQTVANETLYVATANGDILSFNAANISDESSQEATSIAPSLEYGPIVHRNRIVAFGGDTIYKLDAADLSSPAQTYTVGVGVDHMGVAGDYIYAGVDDGADSQALDKISLASMNRVQRVILSSSVNSPIASDGSRLYFTKEDGTIETRSRADMSVQGSNQLAAQSTQPPVVADGSVFTVDADGNISRWSSSLSLEASTTVSGTVSQPLAVEESSLYVSSDDGAVYRYDISGGGLSEAGSESIGGSLGAPVATPQYVFVVDDADDRIYQLDAGDLGTVSQRDIAGSGVTDPAVSTGAVYTGYIGDTSPMMSQFGTNIVPPRQPSSEYPRNDTDIAVLEQARLSAVFEDAEGDDGTLYFYSEDDTQIGSCEVSDGERCGVTWSGLSPDTTYRWYAVASDGVHLNVSDMFWFDTTTPTQRTGGDWPQFHNDPQRTGFSSNPAPSDIGSPVDTFDSGNWAITPMVVSDGVVYFASEDGFVFRQSADEFNDDQDGVKIASTIWASPLVSGGSMFIGTREGSDSAMYRFDASDLSNSQGSIPVDNHIAGGAVDGGQYLFFADYNTTFKVDKDSFTVVDTQQHPGGAISRPVSLSEDSVYVPDLWTVRRLWRENLSEVSSASVGSAITSSPVIAEGRVYVNTFSTGVYSFDMNLGSSDRNAEVGDTFDSTPAVDSGELFVGNDTHLLKLDTSSLDTLATYRTGARTWTPVLTNDTVVVGAGNRVYQLDRDDLSEIQDYDTGSGVEVSPTVGAGSVFVGTTDGRVLRFGNSQEPDAPSNPSPADGTEGIRPSSGWPVEATFSDPEGGEGRLIFYNATDYTRIDSCTAADGERCSVNWDYVTSGDEYHWYAIASDGLFLRQSPIWSFNTGNLAPEITYLSPSDGAQIDKTTANLSVRVENVEDEDITVKIVNTTGDTDDILLDQTRSDQELYWHEVTGLQEGVTYTWFANASDPANDVAGDEQSFEVAIPPELSCDGFDGGEGPECHTDKRQFTVDEEIQFTADIQDDSSYDMIVCSEQPQGGQCLSDGVLCTVPNSETCSTTVSNFWDQIQDYWIIARDEHGNTNTVKGGYVVVLRKTLSVDRTYANITLETEDFVTFAVSNNDNRPYTYTLSATPSNQEGIVAVALSEGERETTGQYGQEATFTVRPKATTFVVATFRAALCQSSCDETVRFQLTNQDTGDTNTETIEVDVEPLERGFTAPGITFWQMIVLAVLGASIVLVAGRRHAA